MTYEQIMQDVRCVLQRNDEKWSNLAQPERVATMARLVAATADIDRHRGVVLEKLAAFCIFELAEFYRGGQAEHQR